MIKWFEIASDFASRQKNLVEPLRLVENPDGSKYNAILFGADWSSGPASALGQSHRVKEFLGAIALFSKTLPEAQPENRDWLVLGTQPIETELAPGATNLIPSEPLARICLSLMADHSEALLLRYFKASAVPNQRFAGLHALYACAFAFNEFRGASELLTQTDQALSLFAGEMFYPDGGMLERSPNYNQGDAGSIRQLLSLTAATSASPGVSLLEDKLRQYDRGTAFMQSNLGGLPRMASYTSSAPPALWQNPTTVTSWRNTFLQGSFAQATEPTAAAIYRSLLDSGNEKLGTSSAAFPYSGYYFMRNGWASKSHWLYFANTPPGRGHKQLDQNGIQISAFGRELLTCGGPALYGPTFLPASQAADYTGIAKFVGESSSFKCNTVVVDGRSQNEGDIVNHYTSNTPMPNPWFTSASYDYVEGTYTAGYGGANVYNALLPAGDSGAAIRGITHKRSVIFLRQAGIWLVTDRMLPTDSLSHSYRQIWNFPARNATSFVGFLPSEVTTDAATQSINTISTTGPNISLHQLGPKSTELLSYSGSKNPYLGWWGYGFGGERLASANVHALLTGSGNQMFVTAIVPRNTGTNGPINTQFIKGPLSAMNVVDSSFGLVNGATVRLIQAEHAQTLSIGNRIISATGILIETTADQNQSGLIIGAQNADLPQAFSFSVDAGVFTQTATITTPTTFAWQTRENLALPSTTDPNAPVLAAPSGSISPLVVHDFKKSNANCTIVWASDPGMHYQVEWTSDLTNWSSGGQSPPIMAIDSNSTYTDEAPNVPKRFYRVRRLAQ
jgi:Heparinase II/III-like protein